ncbi:piggyBac transposable element-derived protein 4 [Bicyclus anynana]|uniref:PiggyBac transposable element-derived protein 4 n=1 Tax=Bicyclus anynana TaxID=110368 RepID=A0A6J1P2S2_BICAN|nr:piggyBac transposable element-derived protein 4 [Bicyclus anynana]
MNSVTSCTSTSGGRVEDVEGGRGGSSGPIPMVAAEGSADGAGPSGSGSGQGRSARPKRPGPHSIDELVVHQIQDLPAGRALETATYHEPSIDEDVPINQGSDYDSYDEDTVVPGLRVYLSELDTPFDSTEYRESDDEDEPATGAEPADDDIPTEHPRDPNVFEWRDFPSPQIPPELRRESFSQNNVGPTTPCDDPYDTFVQIWDRPLMEYIAAETNRYAHQAAAQTLEPPNLHPRSGFGEWYDTTADELYLLFGLILEMGVSFMWEIRDYWDGSLDMLGASNFSPYMSMERFIILMKCLHFNDNSDMRAPVLNTEARLFKIKPILTHLNNKFQQMYTPAQNIALDETLLMWKGWIGRLVSREANRGVKSYEIWEPQTGYLWRFEVLAHNPLEASTPSIVSRLLRGLEYKGYTLWMDDHYQSPRLARLLKSLGFDCAGTVRTDREFVPRARLSKRNLRPGQKTGVTSGDVDVMVWRDASSAMLSTYHGDGEHTVNGSTKAIVISDYTIILNELIKRDRLLAAYPFERNRTRVWYKKLFLKLLNVSVLNSYIIFSHSSPKSHHSFRNDLIYSLISKHSSRPIPIQPRVELIHHLSRYPKPNKRRLRHRCTQCRKRVRTFCVGCDLAVCMEPCFLIMHSEMHNLRPQASRC